MVAVVSVMFGAPMRNPSPDLTDKIEAALLSQVSEIADQICDGMLVTSAAVLLKNHDGLGGPGNVVGFISHSRPSSWLLKREKLLPSRYPTFGTRSLSQICTFTRTANERVRRSGPTASA